VLVEALEHEDHRCGKHAKDAVPRLALPVLRPMNRRLQLRGAYGHAHGQRSPPVAKPYRRAGGQGQGTARSHFAVIVALVTAALRGLPGSLQDATSYRRL